MPVAELQPLAEAPPPPPRGRGPPKDTLQDFVGEQSCCLHRGRKLRAAEVARRYILCANCRASEGALKATFNELNTMKKKEKEQGEQVDPSSMTANKSKVERVGHAAASVKKGSSTKARRERKKRIRLAAKRKEGA